MEACFQCCQLLSCLVKINQLMAVIIKAVSKFISLNLRQKAKVQGLFLKPSYEFCEGSEHCWPF